MSLAELKGPMLPAAALLLLAAAPAAGFHDEGAARCDSCHISHDSRDGLPAFGFAGEVLLRAETPSDLCLSCHGERLGAVLGVDPLNPPPERGGGKFVFLLEDNLNDGADGAGNPIPGDAAGHNLSAPGHGLFADSRYSTSPGGAFPASGLGCTSCHDPHGNGNFRLLHGAGQVMGGAATFAFPAPVAVGTDLTGAPESGSNHIAYLAGMSDWCGNCHGRYHDGGLSGFEHPSDESLGSEISDQYNRYNGDADPSGGSQPTAYLAEVPFEEAAASVGSRAGPSGTSRVMCLTCHRAHGSSAPASGRWDFNVGLLSDDGLISGSYAIPSPYAGAQGTLCSKCHQGGAPD